MTISKNSLELDGSSLRAGQLENLARVSISAAGRERMRQARELLDAAIARGDPVYGLTTGLGAKVCESLEATALQRFSLQTLRGRAQALGPPLPARQVRAAMVVRLNTFARGAAGVSLATADGLAACVNAGLTPVVGESGSIGASDLVLGAVLGLALGGEGRMADRAGNILPAATALAEAGIEPLKLAPRDGLALASHSSFSAAIAALGVAAAARLLETAHSAAALSLEGFRANLSPLTPEVLALRPQAGQAEAADCLRRRLRGSALLHPGSARRLQDPLSIRNIIQIHGAAMAALEIAREAAEQEINGASDNPAVVTALGTVISCGAYHTPYLALAVEMLSRALLQLVLAQLARIGKLLNSSFSDLPQHLAQAGADSSGFAPLLKPAEALAVEIAHLAQPPPQWPSVSASGVEDAMTSAPLAGKNLLKIVDRAARISAIELLVAAQAVELRGCQGELGKPMRGLLERVRAVSARLEQDRPLAAEIEVLAAQITTAGFTSADV